jgi:integrase/recombinase XerD
MDHKFTRSFANPSTASKNKRNSLATVLAIMLHGSKHAAAAVDKDRQAASVMTLYSSAGARKYLTAAERRRFAATARTMPRRVSLFCLLIMWSGCRISEALAITALSLDLESGTVALITLKRRKKGVIRQVPLPPEIINELSAEFDLPARLKDPQLAAARLWGWSRTTAWRQVKKVMCQAAIFGPAAMPKGLRHGFGVAAFASVPPHLVQRWLGHRSLRTTAIYGDVSGREERQLAKRIWDRW